jgi:hypothetical protein
MKISMMPGGIEVLKGYIDKPHRGDSYLHPGAARCTKMNNRIHEQINT